MELTDNKVFRKKTKQYMPGSRNTMLPFEYEWTCFSCEYKIIKRKEELSKIHCQKSNFIIQLKYAE